MASRGNRGGAGDRVLESRHVIGLFMLMLLFSGVFFALGYVMGRNQYDGQVRAAGNPRSTPDAAIAAKSEAFAKRANSAPAHVEPPSDPATQPSSDWGFYNAGKTLPDDNLKPTSSSKTIPAAARSKSSPSSANAAGAYTVQVAALRRESDALTLANNLQRKRFPAFVVSPQADKYYHVRVGPYVDQKSADAAKKGLEGAGFKAIVKH
jgi:cell division septation protein DedD